MTESFQEFLSLAKQTLDAFDIARMNINRPVQTTSAGRRFMFEDVLTHRLQTTQLAGARLFEPLGGCFGSLHLWHLVISGLRLKL
jgi:hypothetical protein